MSCPYNSFLIINPFGIGDVLFSTPLVRNLKEHFPQAKIFYLCNKRTEPIIRNHPLIYKGFIYERDDFVNMKKKSKILWAKAFLSFLAEIKEAKIDVSLDLSLNAQFGFFCWWAGIKKRFGLDYKKRGVFLTRKVKIEGFEGKHVVGHYLDVLRLLNISAKSYPLEVYIDSESRRWAQEFLETHNLQNEMIIGIAPCGGQAFGEYAYIKRWPKNNFSLLLRRLIKEFNAKIFLFAGAQEKSEIYDIMGFLKEYTANCYEFTDLSLQKMTALIEKCSLMVANDTGPLRFADALNKKIVALFGPVDEKVYGIYPSRPTCVVITKKDLPCRPCYRKFRLPQCLYDKKCLKSIEVEEVFKAVKKLLG